MIVLTVGKTYVDIDGYASCLAYRELLKMLGIKAKFVTHSILNYSIIKSLLDLPYKVDDYLVKEDDNFIILDLSNKDYFPDFVKEDRIVELIDHHSGFEKYWNDKLNENVVIDKIGAVATIIVEKYEQNDLLKKMNKDIAKLLMAAILDNTLNFTAQITSDRDRMAYKKLQLITGELDFADVYFNECQNTIECNLEESIVNDLKHQKTNDYLPEIIGQLTIWNIDRLKDKKNKIKQIMNVKGEKWIINIISLKDNNSYIMCSDTDVRQKINELFDCEYDEEFLILKPARLRKELMGISLSNK